MLDAGILYLRPVKFENGRPANGLKSCSNSLVADRRVTEGQTFKFLALLQVEPKPSTGDTRFTEVKPLDGG